MVLPGRGTYHAVPAGPVVSVSDGTVTYHGHIARGTYFLSKEDMAYFGLTSLHVRDDYLASN